MIKLWGRLVRWWKDTTEPACEVCGQPARETWWRPASFHTNDGLVVWAHDDCAKAKGWGRLPW